MKYNCKNCDYKTDKKDNYNKHVNKKIPCTLKSKNKHNIDKNIGEKIEIKCNSCSKLFSRADSLQRHNKTYHTIVNGNENIINNVEKINNQNNNIVNKQNINTQNNIDNQINNFVIQPILHKYDYNDINDLTLFEQYLSITSKKSPYTAFLDNLNLNPTKPQYHNMLYSDVSRNTINVHNGEKWIREVVKYALSNVIDSHRIMIMIIFNRFRIFLSQKATHLTKKAFYYGSPEPSNLYFHKKVVKNIKLHLYNNRKKNTKSIEKIPNDRNDKCFIALSKRFNWQEVENLINCLDDLEINFDTNLNQIKDQISDCIETDPTLNKTFAKLNRQIDFHINNFNKEKLSSKKFDLKTPPSSPEYSPVVSDI